LIGGKLVAGVSDTGDHLKTPANMLWNNLPSPVDEISLEKSIHQFQKYYGSTLMLSLLFLVASTPVIDKNPSVTLQLGWVGALFDVKICEEKSRVTVSFQ
jgi:hypothetical protein